MTDKRERDALRDERVPIPRFAIGDRVRYSTGEEWIEKEAPLAVVTEVKLHMFRQGPDYWSIQYRVVFDKPWPDVPLSGSKIYELMISEEWVKAVFND